MKLHIKSLMGGLHVLSGAASGRRLLASLIDVTPAVGAPEKLFLDFTGIDVATTSFLRESVIGFRDFTRSSRQNIYLVIANAGPAVIEELELFIQARGDAIWSCNVDDQGRTSGHKILGKLDPMQRKTFETVSELGTATAPELTIRFSEENIGSTAWNNRLSSLVAKGLLTETRQGKTKVFRSLLENR